MESKSTKEIIQDLLNSDDYSVSEERIKVIDRPELYAYEEELGKSIFEMSEEELIKMVCTFNRSRKYGKNSLNSSLSLATLEQTTTLFRILWDYYIDNIKVIKNPWSMKLRGKYLRERIIEDKPPFSYADIQKALNKLYSDSGSDSYLPRYIESVIRLYYCGFRDRFDIVDLKESMIDFNNSSVTLPERIVYLDNHTMQLLEQTHRIESVIFPKYTGRYSVTTYQGGYFKFIFMKGFDESVLDDRLYFAQTLSILLARFRKRYDVECNSSNIYYLGFYDYLVKNLGKEVTDDIIISLRDKEKNVTLMNYARMYGVPIKNSTQVKKHLRVYVG